MSFVNFETKEINCKVGYFGARGCGKSTNFRSIYASTSPKIKDGIFELANGNLPGYFDFLPLSLGFVSDFHLKVHLFSIPLLNPYRSFPMLMLRGMDGYVFVFDSRVEAMVSNMNALNQLEDLFRETGIVLTNVPKVFQYNKRDLSESLTVDIMRAELNTDDVDEVEAIATRAQGTLETLDAITKKILQQIIVRSTDAGSADAG